MKELVNFFFVLLSVAKCSCVSDALCIKCSAGSICSSNRIKNNSLCLRSGSVTCVRSNENRVSY